MSVDEKASYYDAGGIETIDFVKAKSTPEQYVGYLHFNALDKLSRANFKESYYEDVRKAKIWLDILLAELEERRSKVLLEEKRQDLENEIEKHKAATPKIVSKVKKS